jgi:hypothetical protein
MKNLASELKDVVEENNDTARESHNGVVRRRAENLDKMEEIYDRLLEERTKSKKDNLLDKVMDDDEIDKIDIDDKKPYFRM